MLQRSALSIGQRRRIYFRLTRRNATPGRKPPLCLLRPNRGPRGGALPAAWSRASPHSSAPFRRAGAGRRCARNGGARAPRSGAARRSSGAAPRDGFPRKSCPAAFYRRRFRPPPRRGPPLPRTPTARSRIEPAGAAHRARCRGARARQSSVDLDEPDRANRPIAARRRTKPPDKRSRLQEFRRRRQKDRAEQDSSTKQFGGSPRDRCARNRARAPPCTRARWAPTTRQRRAHAERRRARKASREVASLNLARTRSPRASQSPKAIAEPRFRRRAFVLTCWFSVHSDAAAATIRYASTTGWPGGVRGASSSAMPRSSPRWRTLQTDAGIEDRAHEQFGWVPEGEQTANVHGLDRRRRQRRGHRTFTREHRGRAAWRRPRRGTRRCSTPCSASK